MNKKKIGQMILAKVLEMNVNVYMNYVNKFITKTANNPFYKAHYIDNRILTEKPKGVTGVVVNEGDEFRFYAPEYVKLDFELLHEPDNRKWKHNMNWIRTKNLFLHHVMTKLLVVQTDFWKTRDRKAMTPVSMKKFLEEYPFPYLDISRLSRLLNNNWIFFPGRDSPRNGAKYLLKDLFWSSKKVHACILENAIYQQQPRMNDREIQSLLKRDYNIVLSVRTICNYRNSVHIPAYNKLFSSNPYNNSFSMILNLHTKSLPLIPKMAGVYEISINKNIRYQNFVSRIIYFGCSNNLRSRIRNYLYDIIKNTVIEYYRECHGLLIRYFATPKYAQVEKELLERFLDKFGSLPVANKLHLRKY